MRRPLASLCFVATTAASVVISMSCSSSTSASADGGECIPYTPDYNDFCGYTTWTKYVEPDGGGDGVFPAGAGTDGGFIHVAGGRVEYINHTPPPHSTEFPIGTLIVKVIPAQNQIFAMAKIGCGYNANGPGGAAINWEWFELYPDDCMAGFIWQGAFPPANQSYGGMPDACNDCHSGYQSNDFVASPRILLKDY